MKRIGLVLGLLAVVLFTSVTGLQAQEDTTALCDKIEVIDAKLGRKLTPFKHYKRFSQAVLKQEESGYQYEIYFWKGSYGVEQKPVTELQLHTLCEEINLVNKPEIPNIRARNRLIFSTTAYTTAFYSDFFEELLGNPLGSKFLYKPIYGAGIGLMTYLVTPKNGITDGMASAYSFGSGLGLLHALLMKPEGFGFIYSIPLWGYDNADKSVYTENLSTMFALSVVEGVGFTLLAKHKNYTWGQISSMGSGGLWGSLYGGAAGQLISQKFEDENSKPAQMVRYSSTLLFSAAGIAGGNYLYNKRGLTRGDVTVINSYGVFGHGIGTGIVHGSALLIGKGWGYYAWLPVSSIVGTMIGLRIGVDRTWSYSYTRAQGNLIALGGLVGGLVGGFGIGLPLLGQEGIYMTAPLTAALGIVGTDLLLRRASSRSTDFASNLQLQFNPMGLVNAFEVNPNLNIRQPWDYRYQNSLVNISYTF